MRNTALVVILMWTICMAVPGTAQVDTGTLVGTLTDASGAVVAGATVTATEIDRFFNIREAMRLEFRGELFNALNHPVFSQPDPFITDGAGQAGVITSTVIPQRQIQFALKLEFSPT